MNHQDSCRSLPPRCSTIHQELAFIGFVLLAYVLVLHIANSLSERGYRLAILNLMPSLWLLTTTSFWVKRFSGNSNYYHAGSKAYWRTGIAVIIIAVLLCMFANHSGRSRTFVNLVILVPFAEEYFFRGLVLDHLVRNLGRFSGLLLTSTLFAFFHAPQGIFIQMFILSVLLCLVTLKTRNVLASAIIHLGWNLVVFYHQFSKPG